MGQTYALPPWGHAAARGMRSRSVPSSPTTEELRAATGRLVPDLIAPGLQVLFCGINPGLYSAAAKQHFARPGNRFWPALHQAGFTERLLAPDESDGLLELGDGITTLVGRATATARDVAPSELVDGGGRLTRRVRWYRPRWVAVLGIGAYRIAFDHPQAMVGPQPSALAGARVWVLPSSSGANGTYPLVQLIRELRVFHDAVDS